MSFGGNAETRARRRRRHLRADRLDRRGQRQHVDQDPPRHPDAQVHGHQEWLQPDAVRAGCRRLHASGAVRAEPEPGTLSGADGKKTVSVRYIDGAGNVSGSFADTITLDTTAPAVSGVGASPSPFPPGAKTTTIASAPPTRCRARVTRTSASSTPAASVVKTFSKNAPCSVGGTLTSTIWDGRNTAHALVPPGTYTIEVVVTDVAGNASAVARGSVVAQ